MKIISRQSYCPRSKFDCTEVLSKAVITEQVAICVGCKMMIHVGFMEVDKHSNETCHYCALENSNHIHY